LGGTSRILFLHGRKELYPRQRALSRCIITSRIVCRRGEQKDEKREALSERLPEGNGRK